MRHLRLAVLAALLCGPCGASGTHPWDIPKREGPLLVAMATCKSIGCVKAKYAKIANPEVVARIVYYTSLLRLDPGDRAASCGLLASMPRDDYEYTRLSASLPTSMYKGESYHEMVAAGQAYWHMSRNLAHALKVCPRFLPAFIRYGILAMPNPHDDYPNWAARVCRSNPGRFLKAFETLSPKDRHYIAKHVIQPQGCKQIAFPEAD